ncbi:MAG: carboxypeptidase regulatory-like domain-containing protein, partial [Verrucomicrobia bacterium]|nr:carboxypeptidase regulatory-like domain-containing protein [Verrucomicrobiota bacterium]
HDYRLSDGEKAVTVLTRVKNTASTNVSVRLADRLRCDTTFAITRAGEAPLVTAYDKWFGAAYGVQAVAPTLVYGDGRGSNSLGGTTLEWGKVPGATSPASGTVSLAPAQEVTFERRLITGRHEIEVQDIARRLRGEPSAQLSVTCTSSNCLAGVDIAVLSGTNVVGRAQTDLAGRATLGLAPGNYTLAFQSLGRSEKRVAVNLKADQSLDVALPAASQIEFNVTDTASNAIPCKVQFIGAEDTPTPDLGPKSRANGCKNLYFSPNGRFSQEVPAGKYYALITRGAEYDGVWRAVEVASNTTVRVRASLRRVIDSRGWISADFHTHSTESGDNTTEAESRIICLVAEGVEFAASTEHNRVMTYRERLRRLGLTKFMATSDGIEMTGVPGMLNHQNAFPLKWHRHAQNGGGPEIDPDPGVQIERLARWDNNSDKLVQQ